MRQQDAGVRWGSLVQTGRDGRAPRAVPWTLLPYRTVPCCRTMLPYSTLRIRDCRSYSGWCSVRYVALGFHQALQALQAQGKPKLCLRRLSALRCLFSRRHQGGRRHLPRRRATRATGHRQQRRIRFRRIELASAIADSSFRYSVTAAAQSHRQRVRRSERHRLQ